MDPVVGEGLQTAGMGPASAATNSGRPTRTRTPSTLPSTPSPAVCRNSPTTGAGVDAVSAAASCSARARGCSDRASTAAASAIACAGDVPPVVSHVASRTQPSVNVPVLSRTTCVTRANDSSALLRASTTPARASDPAAAANAAGVARDSAHGQDTTSSATVTGSARSGSNCHQTSAVPKASSSKAPTNHAARDRQPARRRDVRSPRARPGAGPTQGGRLPCRLYTHDQRRSRFTEPASTRFPGARKCGRLRPSASLPRYGSTLDDLAIGRHDRARADEHDLPGNPAAPPKPFRRRVAGPATQALGNRRPCRATSSIAAPAFCLATSSP